MRRPFRCFYALLFISVCLFLFIPNTIHAKAEVIQKMKGLHVRFMANEGQMDERVSFYARTFVGTVFVTRDGEIIYSLPKIEEKEKNPRGWVLKEELVGGTINEVTAEEKSTIGVSYFKGNDPSAWRSNISTYDLVNIGEAYKGIGLNLKVSDAGELEAGNKFAPITLPSPSPIRRLRAHHRSIQDRKQADLHSATRGVTL